MKEETTPDWTKEELQEMDTNSSTDEIEIRSNPIEEFIKRQERYGRQERYISKIESVLREFEAFLYEEYSEHVCNIDDSYITEFNEYLKENGKYYVIQKRGQNPNNRAKNRDIGDRTRHDYLVILGSLYRWLSDVEKILSQNPVEKALEDFGKDEFDLTPPDRPRIELSEMREFLHWIPDSQARAIILFLLKTGARIGEAMNIDLCCLHINHPLYYSILEKHDINLVNEITDKPDTVYIMPGFSEGSKIRGEIREWGNKRKRENGSVIPLDRELKAGMLEYMLVRRRAREHSSPGKPLFTKPTNKGEGDRMSDTSIKALLLTRPSTTGYLDDYDWYKRGAPTEENITFHYFRHYFTHNHKHLKGVYEHHMPKGTRKYIRGDVRDKSDVEDDNYSHSDWDTWERFVKEPYLENIYKFGLYS